MNIAAAGTADTTVSAAVLFGPVDTTVKVEILVIPLSADIRPFASLGSTSAHKSVPAGKASSQPESPACEHSRLCTFAWPDVADAATTKLRLLLAAIAGPVQPVLAHVVVPVHRPVPPLALHTVVEVYEYDTGHGTLRAQYCEFSVGPRERAASTQHAPRSTQPPHVKEPGLFMHWA